MLINCDTCAVRPVGCADCVVTVLLGAPPADTGSGVDLDQAEQTALAVLADTGLVPPLRLLPTVDREAHWSVADPPARADDTDRAVG